MTKHSAVKIHEPEKSKSKIIEEEGGKEKNNEKGRNKKDKKEP